MNFYYISRLLLILATTSFLLTACNTETTNVADQKGKSVTVSSQDSKTYSFKLEPVTVEAITPEVPEVPPQEEATPAVVDEMVENEPEIVLPEEPVIPMIGPKTGEP